MTDSGLFELTEVNTTPSPDDLAHIKETIASKEKVPIIRYNRVKEKVKSLRQKFRRVVNINTRSGSMKIVVDNWNKLKKFWGGSPAKISIKVMQKHPRGLKVSFRREALEQMEQMMEV